MVKRSSGPNGHIQIIHRAQDKVLREYVGATQNEKCFDIVDFDVEVEVEDDA